MADPFADLFEQFVDETCGVAIADFCSLTDDF
jgi:hypothetical protein